MNNYQFEEIIHLLHYLKESQRETKKEIREIRRHIGELKNDSVFILGNIKYNKELIENNK